MSTEVNNIIDNLSTRFGVMADSIIPELIKYKMCEHLFWLAISIICTIAIWKIYKYCKNAIDAREKEVINKTEEDGWCPINRLDWDDFMPQVIVMSCLSAIDICMFFVGLYVIPWLITPTGTAINYILNLLRGC